MRHASVRQSPASERLHGVWLIAALSVLGCEGHPRAPVQAGAEHSSASSGGTGSVSGGADGGQATSCKWDDFEDCNRDATDGCETDTRCDDSHCGGCGISCGSGTCIKGACVGVEQATVLVSELHSHSPLALDATHAYWVSVGLYPEDGSLARVALDGLGAPEVLASGADYFPSIARVGDSIYWGRVGAIMKLVVTGPGLGSAPIEFVADPTLLPEHIAANSTTLFWVNGDALMSVPLSGGVPSPVAVADPYTEMSIYEIEADSGAVYWRTACVSQCYGEGYCGPTTGGRVMRASADGVVSMLAEGRCGYVGGLHSDETHLYWTEDSKIEKVPVMGGSPTVIAQGSFHDGYTWDLSSDGDWIYALVANGIRCGFVFKVPKAGGSIVPLAGGQDWPNRIAVGASHVYWINLGSYDEESSSLVGGSLRRAAKSP